VGIFPIEVILYDVDAEVECRYGRACYLDFTGHGVFCGADGRGKGWVVDRDGTERDGDPSVGFLEVVLADLGEGSDDVLQRV
jgi:hypothetical protein